MDIETAKAWVDFLRDAGGWGVAIVEAFVIVHLWRKLDSTNGKIFNLLDKTNEILGLIEGKPRLSPPAEGSKAE